MESVYDKYYSVPNTPRGSISRSPILPPVSMPNSGKQQHKHPIWLDMTSSNSGANGGLAISDLDVHVHSPYMSPKPSGSGEVSRINSSRDFREAVQAATPREESLHTFYDYEGDSDDGLNSSQDERWDMESLASEPSTSENMIAIPKDDCGNMEAISMAAAPLYVPDQREDSLAQLRTQLRQGGLPYSSDRQSTSGTVVSLFTGRARNTTHEVFIQVPI